MEILVAVGALVGAVVLVGRLIRLAQTLRQPDLVPCPACRKRVSRRATSCPACGDPL
jgi:predicted amidophosphoribosyltransferase